MIKIIKTNSGNYRILKKFLGYGSCERENLVDILLSEKSRYCQLSLFESKRINTILDYLSFLIEEGKSLYQTWTQEINGKIRHLNVPNKPLEILMRDYISYFIKRKEVHEKCHGGEKGWSVKNSLDTHLPCSSALSFDLKSAFENVPFNYVHNFFYELLPKYFSDEEKIDFTRFFSLLCTVKYSDKRCLPQGSPISCSLFNRILYSIDDILHKKSNERNFVYSRWVDDFTITSQNNKNIENFLGAINITEKYFLVSKEKIFFQDKDIIYLLGYKIDYDTISKNTKEDKLKNKNPPINFNDYFDENKNKTYESW